MREEGDGLGDGVGHAAYELFGAGFRCGSRELDHSCRAFYDNRETTDRRHRSGLRLRFASRATDARDRCRLA